MGSSPDKARIAPLQSLTNGEATWFLVWSFTHVAACLARAMDRDTLPAPRCLADQNDPLATIPGPLIRVNESEESPARAAGTLWTLTSVRRVG